jgi:hypothetical protein
MNKYMKTGIKTGLALIVLNACSFMEVGCQKFIGYSKENAAIINRVYGTDFLNIYTIGYDVGHKVFYDDANYIETAENELKKIKR